MSMRLMSWQQKFQKVVRSKINQMRKLDPKYYLLVLGLIAIGILFKKFRARITFILRTVLNI